MMSLRRRIGGARKPEEEELPPRLELNPFTHLQLVATHDEPIASMLVVPPKSIISASDQGDIQIHNTDEGRLVHQYQPLHAHVVAMCLTHDGSIVVVTHDGKLRIYNNDYTLRLCRPHELGAINHAVAIGSASICLGGCQFAVVDDQGEPVLVDPRQAIPLTRSNSSSSSAHGSANGYQAQEDDRPEIERLLIISEFKIAALTSASVEIFDVQPDLVNSFDRRRAGSTSLPLASELPLVMNVLNDKLFGVGTYTGAVIFSRTSLSPTFRVSTTIVESDGRRTNSTAVTAIAGLGNHLVALACVKELRVYELAAPHACLFTLKNAMDAKITTLHPLALGRVLMTQGTDDTIKVWSVAHLFSDAQHPDDPVRCAEQLLQSPYMAALKGQVAIPAVGARVGSGRSDRPAHPAPAICIGHLQHECSPVQSLVVNPHTLAVGLADGTICLWKNGAYAWRQSNQAVLEARSELSQY
ncbi:uncharacterized protein MONBRDRAFT_33689 [Monosiga brevicollis MX1]|uniref:Uncharacterized protein n=1 Tax=Monosiga brevicollis TaxID=81824 RepID=A9V6W2_MONBE|nr:uncharacterized protein MONBRDRAFT_33689 [Monosiga brevicollis MX1]EDQ86685.1 predicted protein [Monosiga brevicollis MX1]|eukprot:XP_001748521.1 hypothetical protein [Monosiga brevicollis MX1]